MSSAAVTPTSGSNKIGNASVTIPVVDGEVLLGTWQKVLFAEFDRA